MAIHTTVSKSIGVIILKKHTSKRNDKMAQMLPCYYKDKLFYSEIGRKRAAPGISELATLTVPQTECPFLSKWDSELQQSPL